ncbi:hypothetical protein [Prevotella sp. tf2-5]|jgi:hypothetical protein|uniref:hypothetical protein n=1 Tax=Prevotella sp. tf2-5 TaxID=1761889 RepID=UPI0015A5DD50|nr:hypothetical protein [Prevotella sp. tf2-5]
MKKKIYDKPQMEVVDIHYRTPLLTTSGGVRSLGDGDFNLDGDGIGSEEPDV